MFRDTVNAWENPLLTRTGMFWHYEIFLVDPSIEQTINLADFNNAIVVPDDLAQAWRLVRADLDHALHIRPTKDGKVSGYEDLVQSTHNSHTEDGSTAPILTKQVYYLTDDDKQKALDFYKLVSALHIRDNTPEGHEHGARALRTEMQGISDLLHMKKTFDIYFGHSTYWTRAELDKHKVHNVNYVFGGHHIKMAKNV